MFEEVLPDTAKKTLAALGQSGIVKDAYLAGGTALALQIGHRISVDFDFFTPKKFDERVLVQRLSEMAQKFQLERTDWQTVLGFLGETRFTFFYYQYPLWGKPKTLWGVNIADVRDIAPMKLAAVSDRGTRRDFVDLYFLVAVEKFFTLQEVFDLYDKKFKVLDVNKLHLVKSLTYFDDADAAESPQMLRDASWEEVKRFFETEAQDLARTLLK